MGDPRQQVTEEEMAKWNKKLADEGMPTEVGVDLGRQALEEIVASQKGETLNIPQKAIEDILFYWLTRGNVKFGDHTQIAREIETKHNLSLKSIDEDLVKSLEEEAAKMDRIAGDLARGNFTLTVRPKAFTLQLKRKLSNEFGDVSDKIVQVLTDKYTSP